MSPIRAAAGWLALLLLVGGCSVTGPALPPAELAGYDAVELTEVPFYPQQRYQCGPAALAMVLDWSGVGIGPEALTELLYIPARRGSLQPELMAQARRQQRLAYRIPGQPQALLDELAAGHPVLVLQNLGLSWWPVWHYAVVIGYQPAADALLLRSGTTARHRVALTTFLRTWQRGGNWGMVVLPPGRVPASAEPGPYLVAAYDLEATGLLEQAQLAYTAGVERWPAQAGLRLALANAHYAQGRLEQAIAVLEEGIAAGAIAAANYNNLALLLAERQRWDAAEAAAREAVKLGGPDMETYRKTHADICRRRPGGCAGADRSPLAIPHPPDS